jgi:hypothetical protein
MDTITLGWCSGVIPHQVVDHALSLGERHTAKGNDLFKSKKGFQQNQGVWVRDRYFHLDGCQDTQKWTDSTSLLISLNIQVGLNLKT